MHGIPMGSDPPPPPPRDFLSFPCLHTALLNSGAVPLHLTWRVVVLSSSSRLHLVPMTTFSVSSHSCTVQGEP